jgi:hypothetical protein
MSVVVMSEVRYFELHKQYLGHTYDYAKKLGSIRHVEHSEVLICQCGIYTMHVILRILHSNSSEGID